MAGSKRKLYNINPVLNKWEEDNYARLMERKVKGAKSAGYAATSASPTRTRSSNSSSSSAMRTSTCQHTSLGCPASPTTRSPPLAAQAAGSAQQAPDAVQAGQILQQLQRLMLPPEAVQKKMQQQGLKQHGQHKRIAAECQSDADTAPADDLDTCSPQAAAAAAGVAAVQPAELLQCLTAAAGPLVNLLQQLALTQAVTVGSSSPPASAVPPAAAAAAAAAAADADAQHISHPPSSPASGKQQLPGVGPSSPGRRTASPTRKQIPRSSSRGAPSTSSSSSSPVRHAHILKHSAARSPEGAAKQAAPARRPSGRGKPAWDDYRPPPPVGFAGFMPLMVPCAGGAKPLSPSTAAGSGAAGSTSPPLRKQQQQHGKLARAVGIEAGSGRAVQAAVTAAATRAVGRKLQQTTAATTAAAAAAAAAPRLAGERHKGSSPAASKPRLPAAHSSPAPPAAAAAEAAANAAGSLLCHMRRLVAAVSSAGAQNRRYVECRDTDDLASYRSTAASEADNASSHAAYNRAGSVHAEVLCCDERVYLPLVQHINSSSSSRAGSLRAASAGSSGSHEAHTTWGSSHASSRTHSGRRLQQQQQHEVHGSQAAGLPAAAAAFVGGGMEDGWQQQVCRVVLHTDSLDLLDGNAQLRASDLLVLRASSSTSSSNGGGSCWASRWLCDNSGGAQAAAALETGAPPEGAQSGGAAWEPSANVLQCCSEEGDYGDNVWEGAD